jgi:MATE family multidrug resistance protein
MSFIAIFLYATRFHIGRIFTSDQLVLDKIAELMYIAALFQLADGVQTSVGGIFRGMGRQKLLAIILFFSFWVVGLTTGALLAFKTDVEVAGLWWGMTVGIAVTGIFGVYFYLNTDFEEQSRIAQKRLGAQAQADGVSTGTKEQGSPGLPA